MEIRHSLCRIPTSPSRWPDEPRSPSSLLSKVYLFICSLSNDAVCNSDFPNSFEWLSDSDIELENAWKGASVA
jgi:hypothetical protein